MSACSTRSQGFTLIELLMAVAIILAVAAIAVPNLLRARMAANEASAVSALKTYNNAQRTYSSTYPSIGFAASFANLGPPGGSSATSSAAGLIDNLLACGAGACNKSGYSFTLVTAPSAYSVSAVPQTPGTTGVRYFYTDQSGVIRYNATAAAGIVDSPIN